MLFVSISQHSDHTHSHVHCDRVVFDLITRYSFFFGNCNSHVKLYQLLLISTKEADRARPNT